MLIPALDFLTALELDPAQVVERAAAHGLSSAGLLVQPWSGLPFPDPELLGNPAAVRNLAARSADLGVAIDTIEVFMMEEACAPKSFRPALEIGAQLGARAANGLALDPDLSRLADNFGQFCELANEYGMSVLCEIHKLTSLGTIPEAVKFFSVAGLDVKIELDALHFFRGNGKLEDISGFGDRIGRAQICDGAARASDDEYLFEAVYQRQVPGDGELDLGGFLSALPHGIVVGIEVPRVQYRTDDRIARSVDGLNRILQRISRPAGSIAR